MHSWQGVAGLNAGAEIILKEGLVVAGSYGPLTDKVFHLGYMGTQADRDLVAKAMGVIGRVIIISREH